MSDWSKSPIDIVGRLGRSALARRVIDMVERYEEEKTRETGGTYVAVRTRQALLRNGVKGAVERAVLGKPTAGFKHFVQSGRPQDTYEWIALEYEREFSKDVRDAARRRLEYFGVKKFPGQRKEARVG